MFRCLDCHLDYEEWKCLGSINNHIHRFAPESGESISCKLCGIQHVIQGKIYMDFQPEPKEEFRGGPFLEYEDVCHRCFSHIVNSVVERMQRRREQGMMIRGEMKKKPCCG